MDNFTSFKDSINDLLLRLKKVHDSIYDRQILLENKVNKTVSDYSSIRHLDKLFDDVDDCMSSLNKAVEAIEDYCD